MNQYSDITPEQREQMFWRNVERRGPDECWPWQASFFLNGYGQTKLGPSRRGTGAHRVALFYATREMPKGLIALHKCNNKACCNPAHLRWGTHLDNAVDRDESGNTLRGGRHPWHGRPKTQEERRHLREVQLGRRKYSSDTIEAIRSEIGVMSLRSLAKRHNVAYSYVQRIGAGKI